VNLKPSLESRLLHLHKSDGEKSGFVILLTSAGSQVPGIFDLKDEHSFEYLKDCYEKEYETDNERHLRFNSESGKKEEERFRRSQKIDEDSYAEAVFCNDSYYNSTDELYDSFDGDLPDKPEYVWAAKPIKIHKYDADNIWELTTGELNIDELPEAARNSLVELDAALDKFYRQNKQVLFWYEPDYTRAIILKKSQP